MMELDERYFRWLVRQVAVENNHREYNDVLGLMYHYEFAWMPGVLGDENRRDDALDLRNEFVRGLGLPMPDAPATVLEVMIALARRMTFQVGGSDAGWAWQFMLNLGLERMYDPLGVHKAERAREILEALVYRTYSPSGEGGFFPLQNPDEDQTKIEIWYQMAAYIDEVLPD